MGRCDQLIAGSLMVGSVFVSGVMFLQAYALVIEPYGFSSRGAFSSSRPWCVPNTAQVQDLSLLKQLLETTRPVSASGITYGF
jgi:hypothetical protein